MIVKWFERMWSLYFSKVHGRRCCRIVTSLIHSIGRQRAICNIHAMNDSVHFYSRKYAPVREPVNIEFKFVNSCACNHSNSNFFLELSVY